MDLVIAVPTYEKWEPDFGHSLALVMADLARNSEQVTSVRLSRCEATNIAGGRCELAKDAVEHNSSHILWCDSDMRFRPVNVQQLLKADKDIVGVTYRKRRPPHIWVAQDLEGACVEPGDGPLVEGQYVGFGLCLTKTDVFRNLPMPWFAFPWLEDLGDFMGEDIFFCNHARAHGMTTWVDPKASIDVGHVGKEIF